MKRLVLALVMIAALTPPATAQTAGGYAVESVEAHADWIAGRSPGAAFFGFVNVTRDAEPAGGTDTMAEVGRVRCTSSGGNSSFSYSCKVSARVLFLKTPNFQFDGALRSARVEFEARGERNKVEWTAKDSAPSPHWNLQGGERALAARFSAKTPAKVRGTVLGERFSTDHKDAHATLMRGAEVGLIYEGPTRAFTVTDDSRHAAWRDLRRIIETL